MLTSTTIRYPLVTLYCQQDVDSEIIWRKAKNFDPPLVADAHALLYIYDVFTMQ
jgi:hypothetical protein